MKIRDSIPAIAIALGLLAVNAQGCNRTCDEPDPFESGDFLVTEPVDRPLHAEDEWLLGGQLHVDRDARIATIRYTRNGATYEVRYTLEE